MSQITEKLSQAQKHALSIRPKIGGFPIMAEVLRQAGVLTNRWSLPSCQSIYLMNDGGAVVQQGTPLITGLCEITPFNREALIKALRIDQNGQSTFAEFLQNAWLAGVVSYDVDFSKRAVTYYGVHGESYLEEYPAVELKN